MKYALNLAEDKRILSAWVALPNGNYDGMPIVDVLPDGDITEYLYVNDEYIHDPLPQEEPSEPTPSLEDRVSALENKVNSTMSEYEESLQELGVEI